QRDFLASLPLSVEEQDCLFVHANAWAPGEWSYVLGSMEARRSLQATARRLTFCGHVHVPEVYVGTAAGKVTSCRPVDGIAIPLSGQERGLGVTGAVGQRRDGIPAESYSLSDDEAASLTFARVPYDVDTAAGKVRAAGLPPVLAQRLEQGY